MFKLSAIPACGGYSSLAVCPQYTPIGYNEVTTSYKKIRVLTPIIWTLSTAVLLPLFSYQFYKHQFNTQPEATRGDNSTVKTEQQSKFQGHLRSRIWRLLFVVQIMVMLACLGMQLSTLAIGKSLNMMNPYNWSFGQVIAITVWAPPILGYAHDEFRK
jgi:hypothetical protein